MHHSRRQPWTRPLALATLVSLSLWALSSVVWAGAESPTGCPMHGLLGEVEETQGCCSGADAGEAPAPTPEKCPAPKGKACCCPTVMPATPGLPQAHLAPVSLNYWMEFAEPVVHDTRVARTLVIPPAN